MLDLLLHVVRNASREAPVRADIRLLPEIGLVRIAFGDEFVGILVAQFVQREAAARENSQRFGNRMRRIKVREP